MAILSVQSHVAYGHVGNAAAVFPLQRLGFEVWPVYTVQFSNHTGYGDWTGQVFAAEHVADVMRGIAARDVLGACQAVLSGYVGDSAVGKAILEAVAQVRDANPRAIYLCDPVMGDIEEGLYVRPGIPEFFAEGALPAADIVTPNQFELEQLTGVTIRELKHAVDAARRALSMGPRIVLVTSLRHAATRQDEIEMLTVTPTEVWRVRTPYVPIDPAPKGAGDAVAALFLAHFLNAGEVAEALRQAAAAIYGIFAATGDAGTRELQLIGAQDQIVRPDKLFPVERIA